MNAAVLPAGMLATLKVMVCPAPETVPPVATALTVPPTTTTVRVTFEAAVLPVLWKVTVPVRVEAAAPDAGSARLTLTSATLPTVVMAVVVLLVVFVSAVVVVTVAVKFTDPV